MACSTIEVPALRLFLTSLALGTLLIARTSSALTGADTCAAATLSNDSLASPLTVNDTTVGQNDDVDVSYGNNACTEAPQCTGQLINGTPVLGGQTFSGTGTAPDRIFRFRVDSACTLSVSMFAATKDLNVSFMRGGCGNTPADCSCVDDSNVGGTAEELTGIAVTPNVDYYIVVDGYDNSGTPTTDSFSLTITRTAGTCNLSNAVCGDNAVGGGEVCDDGNTTNCDGCHGDCSGFETGCGDGFTCSSEACDDGNDDNCDGCRADCSAVETGCGDGFLCGAEVCDDDNSNDCDGCRGDCLAEETGCGDGFTCGAEECDDDNIDDGDGCSAQCQEEVTFAPDGGNMTPMDASVGGSSNSGGNGGTGGSTGGSTGTAGTIGNEPDASLNGGDSGSAGSGDGGEANGGNRGVGGFGNFNNAGSGGTSAPTPSKKSSSGCTLNATPTSTDPQWFALFAMLSALAIRRRKAR
jgi:cysteine-rich repeat protein